MFPDSPSMPLIGQPFIILPTVDSTNNYAMGLASEGMATHGTTVFAEYQTSGKGQRGKSWNSSPKENIILSVILQPPGHGQPFHISAMVALACAELLERYAKSEVSVKWPNDIYWRDRKAAGILVENKFQGSTWIWTVAGIGMNINQVDFDPLIANPVSLKQITGANTDTLELAKELCEILQHRYATFELDALLAEYNQRLFRRGEWVKLKTDEGVINTRIVEIDHSGRLITEDTVRRAFDQVVWIL